MRALPGIGRYTAGAILSITLDQRHPILEANTIRLLSRLAAFRGDPTRRAGQLYLWAFAEALLPRKRIGDFNQGLMELGSTVCAVRQPDCQNCPVVRLCPTYAQGLQQQIPRPKTKTRYVDVHEAAVVVRCRGKLLLRCCQPGERWAGMWDFPRFELGSTNGQSKPQELVAKVAGMTGVTVRPGRHLATLRHGVTRFRITLECHEATCRASNDAHRSSALGPVARNGISSTQRHGSEDMANADRAVGQPSPLWHVARPLAGNQTMPPTASGTEEC